MKKKTKKPPRPAHPVDEFRELVRQGRLFEVQDWIAAGRPVGYEPELKRRSPLEIAAQAGFHSMVKVLVEICHDQNTRDAALHRALAGKHAHVAKLLVTHGADVNSVALYDVAACYEAELMRMFFDRGVDITTDDNLAEAIIGGVKPLIGIYREYRTKLAGFEMQLAKALRYCVGKKDARGTALCVWAGADPRLEVVGIHADSWKETALAEAASTGNLAALKLFRPDPKCDDLNDLLSRLYETDFQVVDYLVSRGAVVNNKPNGGSSLWDNFLWHASMSRWGGHSVSPSDHTMQQLLAHGAKLVPNDSYAYRIVRDVVCACPDYAVHGLLRRLREAAEPEVMWCIIGADRVRRHCGPLRDLARRIGLRPA